MLSVKIENIRELLKRAVLLAPIEIIVSFLYYLVAVVTFYNKIEVGDRFWTFPAVFCLINVVNNWTVDTRFRWLYYLSGLSSVGFWFWHLQVDTSLFWITLITSQLLVTLRMKQGDNDSFVQNGLCYFRDMSAALLLALISWGLTLGTYYSIIYIFDFDYQEYRFIAYSGQIIWLIVAPVIFLMFNMRENQGYKTERFFETLANFIVSPALLIYTLVLYLYFVKIATVWSLPKGGIAYMVLSFIVLLLIFKALQTILRRCYYNWYYRYFSIWSLPPLVMLWISVWYRTEEYGWTEWRVYLALVAGVATVTMVMFFVPRWNRYRWVALLAFGVLFLFSYIPGINAKHLALYSQEKRVENMIQKLYDPATQKWVQETDSSTMARYEVLYNSSVYVERAQGNKYMLQRFGFCRNTLDSILPAEIPDKIDRYNRYAKDEVYIYYSNEGIWNVSGIDSIALVDYAGENKDVCFVSKKSQLLVMLQTDTLIHLDLDTFFAQRLAEAKMDSTTQITKEWLQDNKKLFRIYEVDNKRIIFENMTIDPVRMKITYAKPWMLFFLKE